MEFKKLQQIFGIGPIGASISVLLLVLFAWADVIIVSPVMVIYTRMLKISGIVLIMLGLGFHFWPFSHFVIGGLKNNSLPRVHLRLSATQCTLPGLH